ncbi:hypothetical protein [Duncaniella muris]|uniref:hypothetical protein n=1 Tax=Duncaniella muris TaxID=2094150 RepID=UPI00272D9E3B|nr:hypothetical protein [Duncaniella muris]
MINLKHEVQERGFTVAHIKTDSIKIPDATPEIIQFVMDYGKLRWRMGDRSGAMGDYAKAVELNPDSPAVMALEQARDIADFFNPDLYNP